MKDGAAWSISWIQTDHPIISHCLYLTYTHTLTRRPSGELGGKEVTTQTRLSDTSGSRLAIWQLHWARRDRFPLIDGWQHAEKDLQWCREVTRVTGWRYSDPLPRLQLPFVCVEWTHVLVQHQLLSDRLLHGCMELQPGLVHCANTHTQTHNFCDHRQGPQCLRFHWPIYKGD